MIQQAIASPDPVLFFEPKGRYWDKGDVDLDAPVATEASTLDGAVVVRPGADVTVVAHGPTVATALKVADAAAAEGVTRIAGTMLADNRPALRVMKGVSTDFVHDELSHGVREIVTRLAAA